VNIRREIFCAAFLFSHKIIWKTFRVELIVRTAFSIFFGKIKSKFLSNIRWKSARNLSTLDQNLLKICQKSIQICQKSVWQWLKSAKILLEASFECSKNTKNFIKNSAQNRLKSVTSLPKISWKSAKYQLNIFQNSTKSHSKFYQKSV